MATDREKRLVEQILKERIENISGKKVVLKEEKKMKIGNAELIISIIGEDHAIYLQCIPTSHRYIADHSLAQDIMKEFEKRTDNKIRISYEPSHTAAGFIFSINGKDLIHFLLF